MKISEPTPSHLLLFPGLSHWKITVYSLYYSSMVDIDVNQVAKPILTVGEKSNVQ